MLKDAEAPEDFVLRVLAKCPVGIAVIDRDGIYLTINPAYCAIYGYDYSEMAGSCFTMVFPPEARENVMSRHRHFIDHGGTLSGEWEVVRRDHSRVVVLSESVILPDMDGRNCRLVYVLDITERKRTEVSLQTAATVFETSHEAIMVTDEDNRIIATNPAYHHLTGYSAAEALGHEPFFFHSDLQPKSFYQDLMRDLYTHDQWRGEIWSRRKNGDCYLKDISIHLVKGLDGKIFRHVGVFSDITQKKRTEELIWQQANFDPLTNLPNRYMFQDRLQQAAKKSEREGRPVALMLIDLDRFKEVNDSLGHQAGDRLLVEVAARISACVRGSDTVARLGGDEFAVILPEVEETYNVERIAQAILDLLNDPIELGAEVIFVSGSIGIAIFPDDSKELDTLFRNADQAMYAAKSGGRNRFSYFTAELQAAALNRLRLATALRTAVAEEQFVIHYQPIVDLATGRIQKAEALLRWQHPTRGLVSPAEFIPLAEDSGLIVPLGDWVFRRALAQVSTWRTLFSPTFQISVNKSPIQFRNHDISASAWFRQMQEDGIDGNALVVEITEGLLLNAEKRVNDKLLHFRDAGVQIAIDDFGTGYSSLAYLQKFDIDYLKIDRSFVCDLEDGGNVVSLCEAMIVMAHRLGIKVIAEGVETEEQRAILQAVGCDYGQGYLFSRPVPAAEFEDLLYGALPEDGTPRGPMAR